MIKNMEHTWGQHEHGLDYKSNDWTNAGFNGNRKVHKGYAYMESTWWEQRMVGIEWTTAELSNQPAHPLTTLVKQELSGSGDKQTLVKTSMKTMSDAI